MGFFFIQILEMGAEFFKNVSRIGAWSPIEKSG